MEYLIHRVYWTFSMSLWSFISTCTNIWVKEVCILWLVMIQNRRWNQRRRALYLTLLQFNLHDIRCCPVLPVRHLLHASRQPSSQRREYAAMEFLLGGGKIQPVDLVLSVSWERSRVFKHQLQNWWRAKLLPNYFLESDLIVLCTYPIISKLLFFLHV